MLKKLGTRKWYEYLLYSGFVVWLEDNYIILFVFMPISGCICFRKKKSKDAELFHCLWEDSCWACSRLEGI